LRRASGNVNAAAGCGPECSGDRRSQLLGDRRIHRCRCVALDDQRFRRQGPKGGERRKRRGSTAHALAAVVATGTRAAVDGLLGRPVLVAVMSRGVFGVCACECHGPWGQHVREHQSQRQEYHAQQTRPRNAVPPVRVRASACVHATMILCRAQRGKRASDSEISARPRNEVPSGSAGVRPMRRHDSAAPVARAAGAHAGVRSRTLRAAPLRYFNPA